MPSPQGPHPGRGPERVAVICGGVGAARFLCGLMETVEPSRITGIVNTGDDMVLHGLSISPDLDTCTYTLASAINPETGWGLAGETWQARDTLERYGGETWFGLGDRDLGTHMYRTQRLSQGASLSQVTAEIVAGWDLPVTLLPMTNDPVRTLVTIADGSVLDFQRYFVERQHKDQVISVEFDAVADAKAAPGVLQAIDGADAVVIAPSNPFVSIMPVLRVPGVLDALRARSSTVVCVSPIVAGAAVKGPAADMMASLGHQVSAVGIAKIYAELGVSETLVIDQTDRDLADQVAAGGMAPVVADTMMVDSAVAAALARRCLDSVGHCPISPAGTSDA